MEAVRAHAPARAAQDARVGGGEVPALRRADDGEAGLTLARSQRLDPERVDLRRGRREASRVSVGLPAAERKKSGRLIKRGLNLFGAGYAREGGWKGTRAHLAVLPTLQRDDRYTSAHVRSRSAALFERRPGE